MLSLEAVADERLRLVRIVRVVAAGHRRDVSLGHGLIVFNADRAPGRDVAQLVLDDEADPRVAAELPGHRRPSAEFTTISSPSTRYQTTAWWGAPSGSIVATTA